MNDEAALDPFELYIQAETGQLCLSYIGVSEVCNPTGGKSLFVHARQEQSATITLGLLHSASAIEELRLARHFLRPPE